MSVLGGYKVDISIPIVYVKYKNRMC